MIAYYYGTDTSMQASIEELEGTLKAVLAKNGKILCNGIIVLEHCSLQMKIDH